MWQTFTKLYRDAFRQAQFVERINGVQIWNLQDCYYIVDSENFNKLWSEMSNNLDICRRDARNVSVD
jgi:Zn-finger protein